MPLLDTLEDSEISRDVRRRAGHGNALNCHTVVTLRGGDPNRKFSFVCVCMQTWEKCNKNVKNKFMQNKKRVSYWATGNGHYLGKDLITFSYTIIFAHMGGCPLPVSMTLLVTENPDSVRLCRYSELPLPVDSSCPTWLRCWA